MIQHSVVQPDPLEAGVKARFKNLRYEVVPSGRPMGQVVFLDELQLVSMDFILNFPKEICDLILRVEGEIEGPNNLLDVVFVFLFRRYFFFRLEGQLFLLVHLSHSRKMLRLIIVKVQVIFFLAELYFSDQ